MSIETAIEGEVKAVEAKAETVAEAIATDVKAEVVKAEGDVKAEVAKVEEKVKAEVKKAVVEIKAEEQLVLRNAELEYLKATLQIQNFQKVVETKSKEYTAYIESLIQKYGLSKAEYTFDAVTNTFKKL
jgi:hypothetical protein